MAQLSYIEQEYQKYVDMPGINFSMLKLYLKSPATYKYELDIWKNKQQLILSDQFVEEKKMFVVGKALHCLALQPDVFNKYYTFLNLKDKPVPYDDFRNKKNREWKADRLAEFAANSPDKTILTSEDYDMVSAMATAIRRHKLCKSLLKDSTVEMPISWVDEETGVACKGTPDIANKSRGFISDIKSTLDVSKLSVFKTSNKFKYYGQLPFYASGLLSNGYSEVSGFYFIFIDKNPPYQIAIYSLTEHAVQTGIKMFRGLLATHKECEESGIWPGYEIYGNEMGIIDLPVNDAEMNYIENHPLLIKNA